MAYRTSLHIRSIDSTLSGAVWAFLIAVDGDLLGHALGDFFERQPYAGTDVASAHYSRLGLAALSAAEPPKAAEAGESAEAATSEQVVQNVVQVSESAAEVRSRVSAQAGLSETVIFCTFVRVAQDFISLRCFLEFLFCGWFRLSPFAYYQ